MVETFENSSQDGVLASLSTPSWEEFSRVAAIAGVGVILVGILGFLIFVGMNFVPGGA